MKKVFNVVVAGAGMVGLTVATLLANSACHDSFRITVVDAGKKPVFNINDDVALRVSAISTGSADVFRRMGAWDTIVNSRACAYRSMRVWDSRESIEGPNTLRFDSAEFAVQELGFIVENNLIQHALLCGLESTNVDVLFDTPIQEISNLQSQQPTQLRLRDGKLLSADLLVGADGANSFVRSSAGIAVSTWNYPQSALVTHVMPERNHQSTAWQRFLQEGPLAFLPLSDGRVSIVWTTTPERAAAALAASDNELATILDDASDTILGKLKITGPRGTFPLRSQHADRYVVTGIALVGDAAHTVHPLAGQGANLGVADAAALASAVTNAIGRGEYPGDMPSLRQYERHRKGANKTMLHFIDALNRLFLSDSETVGYLRRGGMSLFNRSGPIQRQAVQVALGINV